MHEKPDPTNGREVELRYLETTGRHVATYRVRHALVADDDRDSRNVIAGALKRIGFQTRHAENGRKAYDLFLKHRCDLVVTDYQMPVMDGFALINKIKIISPSTPVILVSGITLDDLSEIGGISTVEEVLLKPFSLIQLHRAALRAVK